MKIPFFSKKEEKQEITLGLFLKEHQGVAILMAKNNNNISVKEKIKFFYTNGWENINDNIDEILYQLEKNHQVQISKTIFFVYSHFIDEKTNDIRKPYLNKIKDIVKNLQLEALGYIECIEAVTFYLKNKEEAPLTAVVLELDKKQMSLFVYKGGKLNYKSIVARTDNIIDDFLLAVEGINEKKLLLPSRIIIYDSDNIDDAAAKIVGHKWENNYFVQIPRIDIIKEDEVILGLVQIFSGQTTSQPIKEDVSADQSFGFVIGKDIDKEVTDNKNYYKNNNNNNNFDDQITFQNENKKKIKLTLPFKFPKFSLPNFSFSFFKGKTAIFLGIFIILIGIFLNEYFFHKSYVTVYLPSQIINKQLDEIVEYKVASLEASFSDSISTTGKKEVGNKAKGTIIVHNFDDKENVFSKGTVVEANGIKFLMDTEVKVASSTLAADGSAKLPGKNNVSITSEIIGSEANLPKGTRFKINDLSTSTYFAINDSSLTGGSKKEIRTVSINDVNNLKEMILKKAKSNNKLPIISKNYQIVNDLSETEFTNEKYSKELGEEANQVSLDAKLQTVYYSYDKNQLTNKLINELKKNISNDLILESKNLQFKIVNVKKNKDDLNLKIEVKAKAIPDFNQEEATKKILGKNKKQLDNIFKIDLKTQGYDINISEPLPILNNYLPFFKQNIVLNISSL